MTSHKISNSEALQFILAGNSKFTVRHKVTGNRLTFRVRKADQDKPESPFFVSLLTGSDNESNYSYIGCIWNNSTYKHGKKSHITEGATCEQVFVRVFTQLQMKCLHENFEIWHEGVCGRCGRTLTVPESIQSGYGPECVKIISKGLRVAA